MAVLVAAKENDAHAEAESSSALNAAQSTLIKQIAIWVGEAMLVDFKIDLGIYESHIAFQPEARQCHPPDDVWRIGA